ncbi:MAG TPA: DUF3293 domain-containing protein [Longimicrobium sp.]|nr:DUF3293 domain-containing protein [Longimicrobium sp.]
MTPSIAPAVLSDAELLEAYRHSLWTVEMPAGTLDVRLQGRAADPQLRPAGIVTAYNPASIARTPDENRAADQELMRHVRSLGVPFRRTLAQGTGSGAEQWEEPGFLLLGDVRPLVVELGLVFGQNAVIWIDATGAASLVCTRAGFAGRLPGQKIDL